MVKLKIMDLKNFWKALAQCQGTVCMLNGKGGRTLLDWREEVPVDLSLRYAKSGIGLPLTLEFSRPGDYVRVMAYYAVGC